MKFKLGADGYRVETIEDSTDILGEFERVMSDTPSHSVSHLQVLYVGHGGHRTVVKVGRPIATEGETDIHDQEESFGDVLISITGEMVTVDELIWEILEGGEPRAITKDVQVCIILDMCRNEITRGPKPAKAIKELSFDLKMEIKKRDFNDQILIVNSSLLGDTAKDLNSFTQSLIRETEQGPIKVPHLLLVNTDENRKCELGGGYTTDPRWLTAEWPLGAGSCWETLEVEAPLSENDGTDILNGSTQHGESTNICHNPEAKLVTCCYMSDYHPIKGARP